MGWAFIFEFYPERKRGVKSKNIEIKIVLEQNTINKPRSEEAYEKRKLF
jgi:hypothetical protein